MNTLEEIKEIKDILTEIQNGAEAKFSELSGIEKAFIEQRFNAIMDIFSTLLKSLVVEADYKILVDSVNFPSGKITTADWKDGFNSCNHQLRQKIEEILKIN